MGEIIIDYLPEINGKKVNTELTRVRPVTREEGNSAKEPIKIDPAKVVRSPEEESLETYDQFGKLRSDVVIHDHMINKKVL